MTDGAPFTITVYDKTLRRVGWVGDPVSLTVALRHNAQPTAALTVRSDHLRFSDLAAPGARVTIAYYGTVIMTGRVRLRQGKGPASTGMVTFQVADDWRLLTRVEGWPNPAGTPAQQGDAGTHATYSGNAETVVHNVVQANAIARLGMPVTLGANGNRGGQLSGVSFRFHPLADRLLPAIDSAGIGVTVRQAGPDGQGTGLVVDCYEPATYPRTLSEESGVVQEWDWSQADPEATRVIGGASGDGVTRAHRQIIDAAREDAWGDLIEGYQDARDVRTSEIGWETVLDDRIRDTLTEAAPRAGLSLRLAETATFRYDPTGQSGLRVGDRVRVEVGPGVVIDDVLREAHLTLTADDGLQVTPVVGDRRDDPSQSLIASVSTLARTVRDRARN